MKLQPSETAQKLKKLMSRQRLQTLFTFALGGLLLYQMVQFYQFRVRLAFIDDLYARDTKVLTDLNMGKEYLSSFGDDLNQIRQFLLLPTKSYDFSDMNAVDLASDGSASDLNTQLFDFVSSLGKYEKNRALYDANLTAVKAGVADPVWAASGLTLSSVDGQDFDDHTEFDFTDATLGGATLLKIDLGYDGFFSVPLYYKELTLTDRSSWDSVFSDLQSFLKTPLATERDAVQTVNTARATLKTLLAAPDTKHLFEDKAMALSGEQENEESYYYQLRNSQLAALAEFSVSKHDASMRFSIDAPVDKDFAPLTLDGSLSADLVSALKTEVDARTDAQKQLDAQKAAVADIMADKAFAATMEQLGLHFGPATETDTQVQYPLLDAKGQTLRILFIDKTSLEVKVESPDGQQVQTLSMATEALSTTGKKKAWICLNLSPAIPV